MRKIEYLCEVCGRRFKAEPSKTLITNGRSPLDDADVTCPVCHSSFVRAATKAGIRRTQTINGLRIFPRTGCG